MKKLLWILIPALIVVFCGSASAHFLWMDTTGYHKVSVGDTVTVKVYLHAETDDQLTYVKAYLGFHDAARSGGGELNYVQMTYNETLFGEDGRYYDPRYYDSSDKDNGREQFSKIRAYMKKRDTNADLTSGQDYLLFTSEFTYAQALELGEDIWLENLRFQFEGFPNGLSIDVYTDNTKSTLIGNSGPDFDDVNQPREALNIVYPSGGVVDVDWQGEYFAWVDTMDCDRYDVYIWKSSEAQPGIPTASDLTFCSYNTSLLSATEYKWKVKGHKGEDAYESPVSTFTTGGVSHFLWLNKTGLQNVTAGDNVSVSVYLHAGEDDYLTDSALTVDYDDANAGGELLFNSLEFNENILLDELDYGDPGEGKIERLGMEASGDEYRESLTSGQDLLLFTLNFRYIQNTYEATQDIDISHKTFVFENTDGSLTIQVRTDSTGTTPLNGNGPDFDDGTDLGPVMTPTPMPFSTEVSRTPTLTWVDVIEADSYSVYVWPASDTRPAPLASGITETEYTCVAPLESYTEHKWQVVATKDSVDQEGPVWTFTTYRMGDFTSDSDLTLNDLDYSLLSLKSWSSSWGGTLDADVNEDGMLGGEEAIYLMQYLNGLR